MGGFLGSIAAIVLGAGLGAATVAGVVDEHPAWVAVDETRTATPTRAETIRAEIERWGEWRTVGWSNVDHWLATEGERLAMCAGAEQAPTRSLLYRICIGETHTRHHGGDSQ